MKMTAQNEIYLTLCGIQLNSHLSKHLFHKPGVKRCKNKEEAFPTDAVFMVMLMQHVCNASLCSDGN